MDDALQLFKKFKVNLTRIESRPSKDDNFDYDFYVDIGANILPEGLLDGVKAACGNVQVLSDDDNSSGRCKKNNNNNI